MQESEELTVLGKSGAVFEKLETFPAGRGDGMGAPSSVELRCTEFTCKCPITKQPDYAQILIRYRPRRRCIETKSLKLYLETFRERGIFHEHLAVEIQTALQKVLNPYSIHVWVLFNTRGGIAVEAEASNLVVSDEEPFPMEKE